MPPEEKDLSPEVVDRPSEPRSESSVAEIARDGQVKPDDFKEKERQHEELRMKGLTPSSEGLPAVDFLFDDGAVVAKISDKVIPVGDVDPAMAVAKLNKFTPGDKSGAAVDSFPTAGTADLEADARALWQATDGQWGTDEDAIVKALEGKTPEQIEELKTIYKKNYGVELGDELKDELSGDDLAKAEKLMQGSDKPATPPGIPGAPAEAPESVKEKDTKALERLKEDPEVKAEREKLEKRARETMKEPELGKYLDNMKKFEERVPELQRQYQREFEAKGMSPEAAAKEAEKKAHEQVENTCKNMEKLLEKNDKAPVSDRDRAIIAQQAMEHAANPGSISQGSHGTCNAAVVETRTFTKDPAEATRLLADVATTGKYTTSGTPPVTVEIDRKSLQKQGESNEVPPKKREDGHRDFASQVFQVTAVSVALERKNQSTTPPGQLKYEQHAPVAGRTPPDNGERVMDYSKKPPVEVLDKDGTHGMGMSTRQIAELAKDISPTNSDGTVAIDSGDSAAAKLDKVQRELLDLEFRMSEINGGKPVDHSDPEWAKKAHEAIDKKEGLDPQKREELHKLVTEVDKADKSGIVHVNNEQEMKDTLARLKREGKLPVVIAVDTNNEPFWSDSYGGDAAGSGGGHVVTVTDYDESTGVARMQNQWDKASSHDVSAKQLFDATRDPRDRLSDLEKEVEEARKNNKPDYVREYELLRLQRQQGKISEADYDKKVTELTLERYRKFKESGASTPDQEYEKASREVVLMVKQLENSPNKSDHERAKRIKEAVAKGVKEIDAKK
jgi:hypothetical protein